MAIRGIGDAGPGAGPHIENQYTVKAGDTLESIAKNNNLAIDDLIKSNPQLGESRLMKAGMVLNLPAIVQMPTPVETSTDVLEIGEPGKTFLDRLKETRAPMMLEAKLSPEQFEVKSDGNLLIKNDQLSGFFNSVARYNFTNAWPSKIVGVDPKIEAESRMYKVQPGDAGTPKVESESLLNKAAGDLNFLKIDGVPGESEDTKHPTEIRLAFDGGDALAGKVESESLQYKVAPQESLMIKGEIGSVMQKVTPQTELSAASGRKAGETPLEFKFLLPDARGLNLTADQLQVDTDGNLLIKNFDLSQALQNLFKEQTTPEPQAIVIMATEKLKAE